jgi:hypothetical protein
MLALIVRTAIEIRVLPRIFAVAACEKTGRSSKLFPPRTNRYDRCHQFADDRVYRAGKDAGTWLRLSETRIPSLNLQEF